MSAGVLGAPIGEAGGILLVPVLALVLALEMIYKGVTR